MRSDPGVRFLLLVAAAFLTAEAQQPASPYAGSEACQACHEDIYNTFAKGAHRGIENDEKHGWKGQACESCHGPGQKHVESAAAADIQNPAKMGAAQADKVCLSCHLHEPTRVGRLDSGHAKNQVACTACHKIHTTGPELTALRKASTINAQCTSCHQGVWAQFQKPFRHKLPEGAMSCVDCHNPHGNIRPAMMQTFAANEPGCFHCHGDKRGPFTFEHGPVRFEGCGTCHEPHGSSNPRMLVRHEVRLVCLECHASLPGAGPGGVIGVVPPSFHDLRSARFQNCTVCHQKIHGSYVDRNLLR